MKAWRLKLIFPKNKIFLFFIVRYILATLGILFFLSFYFWAVFNKKNHYLHDEILESEIILVQI